MQTPPRYAQMAKFALTPEGKFKLTVQHYRSKAEWVWVCGKWCKRATIMRKD